jgi:hypothetical protein
MKPTAGAHVTYKLTEYDAKHINQQRSDAGAFNRSLSGPVEPGDRGRTGHVLHAGNPASEGQVYPAFIVATWGATSANLHVLLDGNDTYWATSRPQGDDPGQWQWPAKPEREPGDRPATY